MQDLYELAKLVKGINLKSTDLLTADNKRNSKAQTFYQNLLNQEFITDSDAAEYFFQSTPNHTGYKKLKHTLKEKLVNTFFFYTPKKKVSDYEKALVYCVKYLMAGYLLLRLGVKGIGITLCQKVFKKALAYELMDFVAISSRELRREMAFVNGNIEKFHYYDK